VIRACSGSVRLIGDTDSDSGDAHKLALSQGRAESVKQWLVARETIPAARLGTAGEDEGESRPAVPNDSAANRQRNRRVEVIARKH